MPSESPELRPLNVWERGFTTIYGGIPSSFMLFVLRAVFLLLSGPDLSVWHFVRYTFGLDVGLEIHVDAVDTYYLPNLMASGMYGVFYFNWGRSLGHMAAGAHILDARTGRTDAKLAKGRAQRSPNTCGLSADLAHRAAGISSSGDG